MKIREVNMYLDSRTVGPNNRLPSGKGPVRSNSGQSCDWLKQYVAVARHSGRKFINILWKTREMKNTGNNKVPLLNSNVHY